MRDINKVIIVQFKNTDVFCWLRSMGDNYVWGRFGRFDGSRPEGPKRQINIRK